MEPSQRDLWSQCGSRWLPGPTQDVYEATSFTNVELKVGVVVAEGSSQHAL